jgi:IS5 family transposase
MMSEFIDLAVAHGSPPDKAAKSVAEQGSVVKVQVYAEKSDSASSCTKLTLERDRVLDELDRLLEEDALFQEVKNDLAQRHPHTTTRGRHSTPVEVILRMLVVKHLYSWSYEKTETFVSDSITLRQFCRVYLN